MTSPSYFLALVPMGVYKRQPDMFRRLGLSGVGRSGVAAAKPPLRKRNRRYWQLLFVPLLTRPAAPRPATLTSASPSKPVRPRSEAVQNGIVRYQARRHAAVVLPIYVRFGEWQAFSFIALCVVLFVWGRACGEIKRLQTVYLCVSYWVYGISVQRKSRPPGSRMLRRYDCSGNF